MTSPDRKYFESVIKSLLRNVYQQNVAFIFPRNKYYIVKQLGVKITYLLTYLLNDLLRYLLHGAVILDKLIGSELVKKFLAFNWTRKFITVYTRAHKD
jgi:hypothetical protein